MSAHAARAHDRQFAPSSSALSRASPRRSRTNFDEHGAKIDVDRKPAGLPRRIYWECGRYVVSNGGHALGRFRLLAGAERARDALEAVGGDMRRVAVEVFGAGAAACAAQREAAAAAGAVGGAAQAAPALKRRRPARAAPAGEAPRAVKTRASSARSKSAAADGVGGDHVAASGSKRGKPSLGAADGLSSSDGTAPGMAALLSEFVY